MEVSWVTPGTEKFTIESCNAHPGRFDKVFLDRVPTKSTPKPYTRKAIAKLFTSLYFQIRTRQADLRVYEGLFVKMCRSAYKYCGCGLSKARGGVPWASPSVKLRGDR